MITYILTFLAGGYLTPAFLFFLDIWRDTRTDESLDTFERFMTALMGAATWPCAPHETVNIEVFETHFGEGSCSGEKKK